MKLARALSVYTLAAILGQAVPFLLLPVLTAYLSESEYGTIGTLTAVNNILTPLVFFGITSFVSVEYFKNAPEALAGIVRRTATVPLAATVAATLAIAAAAPLMSTLLSVPVLWLLLAPVTCLAVFIRSLVGVLLRCRNQVWLFAFVEVASAVLGVVLTLLLVVRMEQGWEGRMVAALATNFVVAIGAAWWLVREGYWAPGKAGQGAPVGEALRYGAGLVPHDLGNQLIRMSDRIFLVALAGLAGAGQYAVAWQIASILLVLLSAFNQAWTPWLFDKLRSPDHASRLTLVKVAYTVIAGFGVVCLCFDAAVPLVYRFFVHEKFLPSLEYVPWLSLGYFFLAAYLTWVDCIFFAKKTHLMAMITGINLALNLSLNYVLITHFGPRGAAMAFAASMFVVMVLAFVVSSRLCPMPWALWRASARGEPA